MSGTGLEAVLLAAIGVFACAGVALALARGGATPVSKYRSRTPEPAGEDDVTVFLFDDGDLIDATPRAQSLLQVANGKGRDLDRVISVLDPYFPGLAERIKQLKGTSRFRIRLQASGNAGGPASGLPVAAEVEGLGGRLRLTIHEQGPLTGEHPLAMLALREERDVLHHVAAESDQLIWAEDENGRITWANAAYLAFADAHDIARPGGQTMPDRESAALPSWPPQAIFPPLSEAPDVGTAEVRRRLRVTDTAGRITGWYDVRSVRKGGTTMHFAADARALVAAEAQGRMFVQTLTETFAHLSIGLAIFDSDGRLSTFNPALLDLTHLPVTFLSARPTLGATLDRLREDGILQEPRNYRAWKQGVTTLVEEARRGIYCETWTLTGGQTYRVSGRPHPNGAIAFLFEDITAELSLTRAFRLEIETAQAVLDTLDESMAVFSPAGTLTTCNAAFEETWLAGHEAGGLDHLTLTQTLPYWKERIAPTPFWDRLRNFVGKTEGRSPLEEQLRMTDGRAVTCRLVPLHGGGTLVAFSDPGAGQSFDAPPPSAARAALG